MTTWPANDYRLRENRGRADSISFLYALGYRLVMGETGGVWLVSKHGSQWFETWQAAAESVSNGAGALAKLEERITQCR